MADGINILNENGYLYLENDFFVHYYTIGVLGTALLLGPWIALLIVMAIMMLSKYKDKFNLKNCTFFVSICICLGAACFSGHIVDELFITLFLGFICGYLMKFNTGE